MQSQENDFTPSGEELAPTTGREVMKTAEQIIEALNDGLMIIGYLEPRLDYPLECGLSTLLRCQYFGEGMNPTIEKGDFLLLKKKERITNYGAIHLIQTGGIDVICRPQEGKNKHEIVFTFDNSTFTGNGHKRPISKINSIWELISSQRIHMSNFSYYLDKNGCICQSTNTPKP